jgi:CheY-like chemotaxis protein
MKIQAQYTNSNRPARGKYRITMKDFSALSFDVIVQENPVQVEQSNLRVLKPQPGESHPIPVGPAPSRRNVEAGKGDPGREERATAGEARRKGPRVLIVDDTAGVRESLAKVLRLEGYEVEVAADGREALEKYLPGRTDVVLLDLDMPVTNGWEAFDKLLAAKPDQAIIIITGKAEPARWSAASEPGVLVEKPIDMTMLLACIQQVLGESGVRREARLAVQRTLTRHTRPLPDAIRWQGFRHGGLNE